MAAKDATYAYWVGFYSQRFFRMINLEKNALQDSTDTPTASRATAAKSARIVPRAACRANASAWAVLQAAPATSAVPASTTIQSASVRGQV